MANYFGTFKGFNTNRLTEDTYRVDLIGNTATTASTEIMLAGERPFEVRYDNSPNIFDPVRTSKATVRVVRNDYLEDILSPYAQGTRVILTNVTKNTTEWVGFLTPKVFSMDYVREYEVFDLEAEDCLSVLQYLPYTDDTAYTRSIVTIKSLVDRICDSSLLINEYYWTRSKKVGTTIVLPEHLAISEENFYTTDTDECWMLDEVLEEMCKYIGFTCVQWKDKIYFLDYQYIHDHNDFYLSRYYKSGTSYVSGSSVHSGSTETVDADNVRADDGSISFKPIYNKAIVNANMKACEDFIPTPFDDESLINRRDDEDFYANYEVTPPQPYRPRYPQGTSWFKQKYKEDCDVDDIAKASGDTKYRYFHRLYDSKYWESVYYYNQSTMAEVSPSSMGSAYSGVACTTAYIGGTIVDLGVVRKNYVSEYSQYITPNKLDYTRYLCICERGKPWFSMDDHPVFRLKSGFHPLCMLSSNSYLVINFEAIWERYANRPYINPDWKNDELKLGGWHWNAWEVHSDGTPVFRLKIGDKYWNGSAWTTTQSVFPVVTERTSDDFGTWNEARHTLNNISWDMYINEEGYKIPLNGVDLLGEFKFEIMLPSAQFAMREGENDPWITEFNAYCWFKDLSIKCVQVGVDGDEADESDVVYENVIDEDAVSELSEISVKFTTATNLTKPSYSNVIYVYNNANQLLSQVKEESIIDQDTNTSRALAPEENIVQKFVNQYSTITKNISISMDMDFTPMTCIKGLDVDDANRRFVMVSQEIDYKNGSQTISWEEIK